MNAPQTSTESGRISSIDVVRGAVMVLMAIDHVRVYSGLPAGGATAGLFFTRWVTNFSAPVFAFFAGSCAFLNGRKIGDRGKLARYLLTRGLLLVVLELTFLRFAWTFNFDYGHFALAGVIWMLGWCMVLLAGLVFLPARVVGVIGLATIFFQQIFSVLPHALPESMQSSFGCIWEYIYPAGFKRWESLSILYVIVPWIGVMAAGYGFGLILVRETAVRRRRCVWIGATATLLFLVAGVATILLQPEHGAARPFLFRLLDQKKYPASQIFLLMTLGPAIALMGLAEGARGWWAQALATFGRVPLFYYLLHIPAIHLAALAVTFLREGRLYPEWYAAAPFTRVPPEHRWSLPLLYLVFAVVVSALYFACRWFVGVKGGRRGWLRYL